MGAHSGNTQKAIPTEMPDTRFELHQTKYDPTRPCVGDRQHDWAAAAPAAEPPQTT